MILSNPFAIVNYVPYMRLANAIHGGEFLLGNATVRITSAYLMDLSSGQFCAASSLAVRVPALFVRIPSIIFVRAKKQMGRIYACTIVAAMAHAQAIGDRPKMKFVRNAVRFAHCAAGEANASVAVVIKRTLPFPTSIRAALVNLLPKARSKWASRVGAMAAYVFALITVFWGIRSGQTTTAGAEYGIMGLHKNLPFLCQSRGRYQRRSAISIGSTGVIVPQIGVLAQARRAQ